MTGKPLTAPASATVAEYLAGLPEDRRTVLERLREILKRNLPDIYDETMQYDMITYVVPRAVFPAGYHCKPSDDLPFISLASQKNHVAIYHMGLYMFDEVYEWFLAEYPKHVKTKPDIGKSCIRFKNMRTIPYELLAELFTKITQADYIAKYESNLNRGKK